ncbi:glycosyltransferase [Bacteroides congonensis]
MKIELSIIVPVYNVEQYLLRCLESLFVQGMDESEFEVVVVNDGSPDNSLNIAENFAGQHTNVKVITRSNGGLSAARNTGLEHSEGQYIWFVDSDDFIEPNTVKPLLDYAIANELDALCFNLQLYFDEGKIEAYNNPSTIDGKILCGEQYLVSQPMPPAAVLAFYKREQLIKYDLRFKVGILHEDQEFTPRAYCLAQRISYVDKAIYNYYQREGSIMKSGRNDKRVTSFLTICDSLYDFCLANVSDNSVAYNYFMKQIAFVYSQALAFWDINSVVTLDELKSKPYYPLAKASGLNMKELFKISLMNFSILLYKSITKFI